MIIRYILFIYLENKMGKKCMKIDVGFIKVWGGVCVACNGVYLCVSVCVLQLLFSSVQLPQILISVCTIHTHTQVTKPLYELVQAAIGRSPSCVRVHAVQPHPARSR